MRNWLPRFGAALLLFVLCSNLANAAVDPNSNKLYGFINGNRTLTYAYPGPMYFVQGDVVVNPGATLTIEPGVLVYFEADHDTLHGGDYPNLSEIRVLGSLVADATVGDSIRFWNSGVGEWGQIRVESGASASLNRVSIRSAKQALNSMGNLTVSHSSISATDLGVMSQGTSTVMDCEIADAGQGLLFNGGGNNDARGCRFTNVLNGAVLANGFCHISESTIQGRGNFNGTGLSLEYGAHSTPTDSVNVQPIVVSGFSAGVALRDGAAVNVVSRDNGDGVVVNDGSANRIQYCTLVRNTRAGLYKPWSYLAVGITNSIIALNNYVYLVNYNYSCSVPTSCAYSNLWSSGPITGGCWLTQAQVASFDPFFQDPFGDDFRLSPASIFYEYSNSGGQIGAYGPGPGRPVPARTTTWGRLKTGYR